MSVPPGTVRLEPGTRVEVRRRFDRHQVIARWTYPLWLYVSVTGVVIYLMLYKLFVA